MTAWLKLRNKIISKVCKWLGIDDPHQESGGSSGGSGSSSGGSHGSDYKNGDEMDYSQLAFVYGGLKGEGAKVEQGCRIESLKVNGSGMSYKWAKGGCEKLGATSRDDYKNTFACLFCRVNGSWIGGKFDEISTSRLTRDFKNINSGYRGWDKSALAKADAFAFIITNKTGSKRTNVIRCGK